MAGIKRATKLFIVKTSLSKWHCNKINQLFHFVCHRTGNGQGKKNNILQRQGKVTKFYFESGKTD